jgi:hypothetical protein
MIIVIRATKKFKNKIFFRILNLYREKMLVLNSADKSCCLRGDAKCVFFSYKTRIVKNPDTAIIAPESAIRSYISHTFTLHD